LPIYSVEHANQIADTYTRYEKTHCQSHVEELLDGLCLFWQLDQYSQKDIS